MNKLKKILKVTLIILLVLIALLVIAFIATNGTYTVPPTAAQDSSLSTLQLNGATFHTQTYGDPQNPVIIVVHGGPGADFRSLLNLKDLADHYFVVFYDQRGSGLSPRVDDPTQITYHQNIADLNAFVEHFSNEQPLYLIGHSFGGTMVSTYLAQHPQKVAKAVLIEPGPLNQQMSAIGPNLQNSAPAAYLKALFESFHIQNPPDQKANFDYVTGQLIIGANPGYWCNQQPHASVQGWRFSYDAYTNVIASFYHPDQTQINTIAGIENYTAPVLFLASQCNTVIGEDFQRQQIAFFPNAQLAVVENAGHELIAEQPQPSLALIRDFLAK